MRFVRVACLSSLVLGCGRIETTIGVEFGEDAGVPKPVSVYIEAESGKLSGFTIETDPSASGGKYILPPPGAWSLQGPGTASAEYTFSTNVAGTYFLWGRIHSPDAEHNTFWVSVDGGPFRQWRLSTGVIWFWGATTSGLDYGHPIPYALDAGGHRIDFRNSAPGVGLDILYVTVPGDIPPGNDTPCHPPHSIQLADGGCEPSCGSHGNTYVDTMCGTGCTGQPLLVAYDCSICCFIHDAGPDRAVPDAPAD